MDFFSTLLWFICMMCRLFTLNTVVSTRRHPPHPLSALILHPRRIVLILLSLWSQNYATSGGCFLFWPNRYGRTPKLHPALLIEPSNYNQLPKNTHVFRKKIDMSTTFYKRWTWTFAQMFYMYAHPETLPPGGAFYFRRLYLVVRSTYTCVHVSKKSAES